MVELGTFTQTGIGCNLLLVGDILLNLRASPSSYTNTTLMIMII
jgi:hypothetical protein